MIVNGLPLIQSEDPRKATARPWPSVMIMAIQVHGRLVHSSGVLIPLANSKVMPNAIPAITGVRMSIT